MKMIQITVYENVQNLDFISAKIVRNFGVLNANDKRNREFLLWTSIVHSSVAKICGGVFSKNFRRRRRMGG